MKTTETYGTHFVDAVNDVLTKFSDKSIHQSPNGGLFVQAVIPGQSNVYQAGEVTTNPVDQTDTISWIVRLSLGSLVVKSSDINTIYRTRLRVPYVTIPAELRPVEETTRALNRKESQSVLNWLEDPSNGHRFLSIIPVFTTVTDQESRIIAETKEIDIVHTPDQMIQHLKAS